MKIINLKENVIYVATNRFVFFFLLLASFVFINRIISGSFLPSTETKDLWFYSGLVMIVFSTLFIEPFYSSPKNVVTNAIPLLLVLLSIKHGFINQALWWAFSIYLLALIILSIFSMALEDKDMSPDNVKNWLSNIVKNIVVAIGQGKFLYSVVFIYFLVSNYSMQNIYTLIMFIVYALALCINPKELHNKLAIKTISEDKNKIGDIFGVQSKKIFLVKLYEDKRRIRKFNIVQFRYSMQDSDDSVITGIVFDTYLLNQEKWAKVLQLGEPMTESISLSKNAVYLVAENEQINQIEKNLNVNNFVGIVIEGSSIGKIKFEYSKKSDDIQVDDLLELVIGDKRLFYQVIGGTTDKEKLEARNETGFIEGEAIQLGQWQGDKLSFQKYGWVPSINTPVFKADTSDIIVNEFKYPYYQLGVIPGTTLPSVIDLHAAVSHHVALLGVTGSGKSFIAMEIIKELAKDVKIICVDLTGEWNTRLKAMNPHKLIDASGLKIVEDKIAQKEAATKNKNSAEVLKYKKEIQDKLNDYVKIYAESNNNLAVFELPDLSNTSFILEFTQMFLESVFVYAKQNQEKRFCIVLEEAHTVIPETSFLGDLGDYSSNKGLVSKMAQIALQGRKYGVGFLIIAQRTANVSKTVLTQCNTVICFQAFDETSFAFLGNYIGKDMIQALPNMKQYHAVVAGKAMKSNMPIIIDLTRR